MNVVTDFNKDFFHTLTMSTQHIITQSKVKSFMNSVVSSFPRCVGAVVADRNGFVVSSDIKREGLDENQLALQAITNRNIVDLSNYKRVIRSVSNGLKVMLVLEDDPRNLCSYKKLYKILNERNPFN